MERASYQGVKPWLMQLDPTNIEETARGVQATLTDFGLVKAMAGSTVLTFQGTPLGSPGYVAPGQ